MGRRLSGELASSELVRVELVSSEHDGRMSSTLASSHGASLPSMVLRACC